jgi:chaperonin cofactor prefoldin
LDICKYKYRESRKIKERVSFINRLVKEVLPKEKYEKLKWKYSSLLVTEFKKKEEIMKEAREELERTDSNMFVYSSLNNAIKKICKSKTKKGLESLKEFFRGGYYSKVIDILKGIQRDSRSNDNYFAEGVKELIEKNGLELKDKFLDSNFDNMRILVESIFEKYISKYEGIEGNIQKIIIRYFHSHERKNLINKLLYGEREIEYKGKHKPKDGDTRDNIMVNLDEQVSNDYKADQYKFSLDEDKYEVFREFKEKYLEGMEIESDYKVFNEMHEKLREYEFKLEGEGELMEFIEELGKESVIKEIVKGEEKEEVYFEVGGKFVCGLFDNNLFGSFINIDKVSEKPEEIFNIFQEVYDRVKDI